MLFGFSDMSMSPKTNYMQLWRHQDTLQRPRKSRIISGKYYVGQSCFWEIGFFENYGKAGGRTNPEDPFYIL